MSVTHTIYLNEAVSLLELSTGRTISNCKPLIAQEKVPLSVTTSFENCSTLVGCVFALAGWILRT